MANPLEGFISNDDIFDVYHFEGDLGQGQSRVVKGVNFETGQDVAIKIMNTSNMSEHEKKSLFQELFILRNLNHPNIMELIEAYEDAEDAKFYIVMELLRGGTLGSVIQEYEYFEEEAACKILKPIADALRFMHEKGIVHRDLKVSILHYP